MTVEIAEMEVVPRGPTPPAAADPGRPASPPSRPPSPELTQEIARTTALLHDRDRRLHAD